MICMQNYQLQKNRQFTLNIEELVLKENKKYFIIGASGSGKSTLMRTCLGLDKGKGTLYRQNSSNEKLLPSDKAYKQGLMYLSQSFALWEHLSVEAHLNFTLSKGKTLATHKETDYYLDLVNLKLQCSQKPPTLSGGEQQRVAIARGIVKDPPLLLCDEPTGALDLATGRAILKLLKSTTEGTDRTVFLVTHNSTIAAMADRVIRLRDGRISSDRRNPDPTPPAELEW